MHSPTVSSSIKSHNWLTSANWLWREQLATTNNKPLHQSHSSWKHVVASKQQEYWQKQPLAPQDWTGVWRDKQSPRHLYCVGAAFPIPPFFYYLWFHWASIDKVWRREQGEVRPGIAQLYRIPGKQWFLRDIPGGTSIVGRFGGPQISCFSVLLHKHAKQDGTAHMKNGLWQFDYWLWISGVD